MLETHLLIQEHVICHGDNKKDWKPAASSSPATGTDNETSEEEDAEDSNSDSGQDDDDGEEDDNNEEDQEDNLDEHPDDADEADDAEEHDGEEDVDEVEKLNDNRGHEDRSNRYDSGHPNKKRGSKESAKTSGGKMSSSPHSNTGAGEQTVGTAATSISSAVKTKKTINKETSKMSATCVSGINTNINAKQGSAKRTRQPLASKTPLSKSSAGKRSPYHD